MTPPLLQAKARNRVRQCSLAGCHLPRIELDLWCKQHATTARRYGHPQARPLPPKLWVAERKAIRALLSANSDHPGKLQVLRWLEDWTAAACAESESGTRTSKGAEEVARLIRHGVSVEDILVEVCAAQAYLMANPRSVPDDLSWDFALSRSVFALAPRPRRATRGAGGIWPVSPELQRRVCRSYSPKPRRSALRFVGAHLRRSMAPFMANVLSSMQTPEQIEDARLAAMRAPLRPAMGPAPTN